LGFKLIKPSGASPVPIDGRIYEIYAPAGRAFDFIERK
jgi:hypothetical protein